VESGYPVSGDTAVVSTGHTVDITGQQQVTVLTVNGTGVLQINGSGSPYAELEFPNTGTPSITIAGSNGLVLMDNARLKVSKSLTASGNGSVVGQDDASCEIMMNNARLTVQLLVHGELTFLGASGGNDTLKNEKKIAADAAGTIELASSLELVVDSASADCDDPRWVVDVNGSAKLIFNIAATTLEGAFFVDEGTLEVNQNVTTGSTGAQGKLKFMSGSDINVASGKTFTFSDGVCSGSSCGSGTSMTGNNNCP
jgi:hypothetical protein